jgi:hypothetical protein
MTRGNHPDGESKGNEVKSAIGLVGVWVVGASLVYGCSGSPASAGTATTDDPATLLAALAVNSDGSDATLGDASSSEPIVARACDLSGIVDGVVERFDTDEDGALSADERAALTEQFADGEGVSGLLPREGGDAGVARGRGHARGPRGGRVELLLAVYDGDDSGTLEAGEIAALQADIAARCEARLAKLVAEFDADGDGELSDEEWQAAEAALRARCERRQQQRLAELDADGDGRVGPGERGRAGVGAGRPFDAVSGFDADGDGELDARERGQLGERGRQCVREERPLMPGAGDVAE